MKHYNYSSKSDDASIFFKTFYVLQTVSLSILLRRDFGRNWQSELFDVFTAIAVECCRHCGWLNQSDNSTPVYRPHKGGSAFSLEMHNKERDGGYSLEVAAGSAQRVGKTADRTPHFRVAVALAVNQPSKFSMKFVSAEYQCVSTVCLGRFQRLAKEHGPTVSVEPNLTAFIGSTWPHSFSVANETSNHERRYRSYIQVAWQLRQLVRARTTTGTVVRWRMP